MSWKSQSNDGIEDILDSIELLDTSSIGSDDVKSSIESLSQNKALEARLEDIVLESPEKVRGREFSIRLTQVNPTQRTKSYKNEKVNEWNDLSNHASRIYASLIDSPEFSVDAVHRLVHNLMNVFSKDRNILLTLSQLPSSTIYSPSEHALKTSIISICIGASMGYSEEQIVDLGVCAFVSDFGMAYMEEIYKQPDQLTQEALLKLRSHPMISANIIDGVRGMPAMASLVVYQVHERENGTGYPKKRNGRFIHAFAKVIAVADVFQALCSPRAHRSAFRPFEAMTKVVGMVRLGSLSHEAVKPFMNYTSLYPIGSLVKLSDSRIGRVVMANGEDIKKPVISILKDEYGIKLKETDIYQVDLRRMGDIHIIQALKESDLDVQKLDGL